MGDMMTKSVAESATKETAAIGEMKREISAKKIQQAQDGIKAVEKKIIAQKEEITAQEKKVNEAKKAEEATKDEKEKKEKAEAAKAEQDALD